MHPVQSTQYRKKVLITRWWLYVGELWCRFFMKLVFYELVVAEFLILYASEYVIQNKRKSCQIM